MFSGVIAMLRLGAAGRCGRLSWAIAAAVAGLLTWRTRLHPMGLLVGGAAAFIAADAIIG